MLQRVARNLKFYALSLRAAMDPGQPLAFAANTFRITRGPLASTLFSQLNTWELLNLSTATILELPEQLQKQCGVTEDFLAYALKLHSIQEIGKTEIMRKFDIQDEPVYFVAATKHYSWPKSAGAHCFRKVATRDMSEPCDISLDRHRCRQSHQRSSRRWRPH